MELLHILLWQTNVAVIDVPIPPSWRVGGRGNCSFLYKLHHQVGYGCTHRRAHGAAKRLMVVLLFISKIRTLTNFNNRIMLPLETLVCAIRLLSH